MKNPDYIPGGDQPKALPVKCEGCQYDVSAGLKEPIGEISPALTLVNQTAEKGGVTETQKASDQMLCVQLMNSIRKRAKEVVMSDLIHS